MQTNTPPRAEFLPIDKLRPFENHPFRVKDDAEMDQLVFSVLTQGLLTPIVVRKTDTEEYEVISGHRRLRACQKAGIETVPALIYSMDRDAAIIALVDSNLHREHLLPSEKAFAYKMKMEAMNHQGRTSGQLGQKWTRDSMANESDDSSRQIQRYIRLTYLIPEILQMVDEKKIALTPAVELSYLTESEHPSIRMSAFTKRVACPKEQIWGLGDFPNKQKSGWVAPRHCLPLLYQRLIMTVLRCLSTFRTD